MQCETAEVLQDKKRNREQDSYCGHAELDWRAVAHVSLEERANQYGTCLAIWDRIMGTQVKAQFRKPAEDLRFGLPIESKDLPNPVFDLLEKKSA